MAGMYISLSVRTKRLASARAAEATKAEPAHHLLQARRRRPSDLTATFSQVVLPEKRMGALSRRTVKETRPQKLKMDPLSRPRMSKSAEQAVNHRNCEVSSQSSGRYTKTTHNSQGLSGIKFLCLVRHDAEQLSKAKLCLHRLQLCSRGYLTIKGKL